MRRTNTIFSRFAIALGLMAFIGCGTNVTPTDPEPHHPTGKADNVDDQSPPLSNLDEVLPDGVPENEAPPPTDDNPPEKGYFLLNKTGEPKLQSAVKSQGSRGVCSIFAGIAYMEHLYLKARLDHAGIAARVPEDIDFSEQYLQWSVKFEVNSFPDSSGSNASYNLRSMSDYGVILEQVWPYETRQWSSADDEKCDGEKTQPTYCYTNGHPSDDAKSAPKYKLPRSRYLSARAIKNHIWETETAAVLGLRFFYQSWNHRKSKLTTNRSYWSKGYVLYPNAKDEEDSSGDRRAGHGILIVGWDDTLEVPKVDADGKATCDDTEGTKVDPINGTCPEGSKMIVEKGFYIFKNSWGTGSFGAQSAVGDGYGYISQRYVHEYASVRVADVPTLDMIPEPPVEEPKEMTKTFEGTVAKGENDHYEIELGDSAKNIVVTMTGDSGDADLYTKFGSAPDSTSGKDGYDCRPYINGSEEKCEHAAATDTKLFVMARGWASTDSPYTITVTWTE